MKFLLSTQLLHIFVSISNSLKTYWILSEFFESLFTYLEIQTLFISA